MPEKGENKNQEENLLQAEVQEARESQFIFRDPRLEDCDDMLVVINEAVEQRARIQRKKKMTREELLPRMEAGLDKIKKGQDICVVAEKDGHVVGWIVGSKVEGAEVPTVNIGTANFLKKFRKGGFVALGLTWLGRIKKEWPDVKELITETNEANPAKGFYELAGFVELGPSETQKGYVKLKKIL